jgi:hypothetical protein
MIKNFNQFNESSESKGSELFFTFEDFETPMESDPEADPGIIDDLKKQAKKVKDKIVKAITPDLPKKEKTPAPKEEKKEKGGLMDYLEAIAFKECSGIPTKINSEGYMGKYQFSIASLNDVLKVKSSESLDEYKKRISKYMPDKFGSVENLYNRSLKYNKSLTPKDVAFFRTKFRSKGLSFWPEKKQDQAMIQLLKNNEEYLKNYGIDLQKYSLRGKKLSDLPSKNGVRLTISGLLAGAHLLGPKSVQKFLNSGKVEKDGYGTPITEYLKKFGGYFLKFP